MNSIPTPTINVSDYKNSEVRSLALHIVNFLRNLRISMANGLEMSQANTLQYNEIIFRVPEDGSSYNPYPLYFTWEYPSVTPRSCIIGQIYATDGSRSVLSGGCPDWKYEQGRIVIYGLPMNLVENKEYFVRFETKA